MLVVLTVLLVSTIIFLYYVHILKDLQQALTPFFYLVILLVCIMLYVRREREDWWNSSLYCLSLVGIYIGVHDLFGVQGKPEYFLV